MPTYRVEYNGGTYKIESPTELSESQIMSQLQGQPAAEPEAPPSPQPQGGYRDFAAGTNRGIAGLAGLPVDAVTGAINAFLPQQAQIRNPMGGSENIQQGLSKLGVNSQGPRNFAGMAGEYLATAPIAGGYSAAKAGTGLLAGVGKEALSGLLAAGGGYAASQAVPGNPLAEMAGALTPAGMRASLAAVAKPVIRGAPTQAVQEGIDLANRVGAPATAAATVPSKPIQTLAGASSATPGGVSVFKQAGADAAVALRDRIAKIAGGEADDLTRAGNTIRSGLYGEGTGFVARSGAKANALYDEFARKVGPTTPTPASSTYQFLSNKNKGVPGAPEMSQRMFIDDALQKDADAFFADINAGNGSIPFDALKQFRTRIGDQLADPELIGSVQRKTLSELYEAVFSDMADAARRSGAEKEFNRANNYYRARAKRVEDFFTGINKKVSGEEAYQAAVGATPNGPTKIQTLKKSLEPGEWEYVRRTIVTRMGRPVASQATEGGVGFSPNTFLTNYEAMKRNGTAKAVFGSGQFRKDIDDVARYSSNLKGAADILANPSGTAARGLTASVLFYALGLPGGATVGALAGGGTGALVGAATAAAGIGGATIANHKLAVMLNSPSFVNWLAQSTRIPAQRLPGHVARLATIAGNDPELADALADYATSLGQQ